MDKQQPVLSEATVAVFTDLLNNVQLPVSHPKFEEIAAAWAVAKRELAELSDWHDQQ